jgi:hypothetical protein
MIDDSHYKGQLQAEQHRSICQQQLGQQSFPKRQRGSSWQYAPIDRFKQAFDLGQVATKPVLHLPDDWQHHHQASDWVLGSDNQAIAQIQTKAGHHDFHPYFSLMNAAYAKSGMITSHAGLLRLWHIAGCNQLVGAKHQIDVKAGQSLQIIEFFTGTGSTHSMLDLHVQKDAHCTHWVIDLSQQAGLWRGQRISVEKGGHYQGHTWLGGSELARIETVIRLVGDGARGAWQGLSLPCAKQYHDFQTSAHHLAPHTHSHQEARMIADEQGTGIFQTSSHVHPPAHGAVSDQHSRHILLSDKAHIFTVPNLQIDQDQVQASHGANIGQLDEKVIFYLRSRGLTRMQAIGLMMRGFVGHLLESVPAPGDHQRFLTALTLSKQLTPIALADEISA